MSELLPSDFSLPPDIAMQRVMDLQVRWQNFFNQFEASQVTKCARDQAAQEMNDLWPYTGYYCIIDGFGGLESFDESGRPYVRDYLPDHEPAISRGFSARLFSEVLPRKPRTLRWLMTYKFTPLNYATATRQFGQTEAYMDPDCVDFIPIDRHLGLQ